MSNVVANLAEAKAKQIRSTKGRNSKNSSKVFCFRIEDLEEIEVSDALAALNDFFGPVDAVDRRMQYEGWR